MDSKKSTLREFGKNDCYREVHVALVERFLLMQVSLQI